MAKSLNEVAAVIENLRTEPSGDPSADYQYDGANEDAVRGLILDDEWNLAGDWRQTVPSLVGTLIALNPAVEPIAALPNASWLAGAEAGAVAGLKYALCLWLSASQGSLRPPDASAVAMVLPGAERGQSPTPVQSADVSNAVPLWRHELRPVDIQLMVHVAGDSNLSLPERAVLLNNACGSDWPVPDAKDYYRSISTAIGECVASDAGAGELTERRELAFTAISLLQTGANWYSQAFLEAWESGERAFQPGRSPLLSLFGVVIERLGSLGGLDQGRDGLGIDELLIAIDSDVFSPDEKKFLLESVIINCTADRQPRQLDSAIALKLIEVSSLETGSFQTQVDIFGRRVSSAVGASHVRPEKELRPPSDELTAAANDLLFKYKPDSETITIFLASQQSQFVHVLEGYRTQALETSLPLLTGAAITLLTNIVLDPEIFSDPAVGADVANAGVAVLLERPYFLDSSYLTARVANAALRQEAALVLDDPQKSTLTRAAVLAQQHSFQERFGDEDGSPQGASDGSFPEVAELDWSPLEELRDYLARMRPVKEAGLVRRLDVVVGASVVEEISVRLTDPVPMCLDLDELNPFVSLGDSLRGLGLEDEATELENVCRTIRQAVLSQMSQSWVSALNPTFRTPGGSPQQGLTLGGPDGESETPSSPA